MESNIYYLEFRFDEIHCGTWHIDSNGDIGDTVMLSPLFNRCKSLKCDLRITGNAAIFKTHDDFRVCYHPTRGTTVESPVVDIDAAARLIDGIKSAIADYREDIEDAMAQFAQNSFIEGDKE